MRIATRGRSGTNQTRKVGSVLPIRPIWLSTKSFIDFVVLKTVVTLNCCLKGADAKHGGGYCKEKVLYGLTFAYTRVLDNILPPNKVVYKVS